MLVIAGLLEGELFPKFLPEITQQPEPANQPVGTALSDLLQQGRPGSRRDYAKLIIWSFIAGFAERYIPDTLSRFISRKEADRKNAV
jgi:hypothetical protein